MGLLYSFIGPSGNRKRWQQTGPRPPPLSTIRTRYGNSVSTPEAPQTCKTQQNSLQKGSRYGISISATSSIRTRLRTPFLRTPFPRLLVQCDKGARNTMLHLCTVSAHHPWKMVRETQEGCGGLRGENPRAFPKAGPIFQQPFSLPENA